MSERKMHKMLLVVEHKYLTEDSEVRIYLSKVQESRWPKIKRFYKKALYTIIRILVSVIITLLFKVWVIEYAYNERGYKAYGGEYLLIMWVFIIAYWITDYKKNS